MDSGEDPDGELREDREESTGSGSLSGSFGSSLSSSQDFRRQMKPPNKKKYEEEMEELMKQIRTKESELRAVGVVSQESVTSELQGFRGQRDAAIGKRKKLEGELRTTNQEITRKMGLLSRTESNLHYKNENKIDDAIRNMEWQLKCQNFSLKEERKIVAEIDKLKRSKKTLIEYFTQKKDVDKMRESQRRIRAEKDNLFKIITNLKASEEELKKSTTEKKAKSEILRKDLNDLHERKRQINADFKQHEADYHKMLKEKRHNQRKESFRKKEEDRRAKEEAWKKERMEFELQRVPFEDEINLCNTLISYLQRFINTEQKDDVATLPSPREEQPETQIGATLGPADSLDDGMFVLLKKSENEDKDYSVTSKKPQRRSRKGRKLSVTKPLAHTPQIIAQFSSLTLNAPSNMSEVAASMEQLQARKRYYDQQAASVPRPLLGSLSSSFSSSGSMGSLESPLRERNATWSFVVPPAIAENQTPSDAGVSAESGFHDMSRQVSKTESSESTADATPDNVLDELIRQSSECGDGEHSRSSSDTITPDEHANEEVEPVVFGDGTQRDEMGKSGYKSNPSIDNDSNSSLVFEDNDGVPTSPKETISNSTKKSSLRGNYSIISKTLRDKKGVDATSIYDSEFPPALGAGGAPTPPDHKTNFKTSAACDESKNRDKDPINPVNVLISNLTDLTVLSNSSSISIVVDSYDDNSIGDNNISQHLVPDSSKSDTTAKVDTKTDNATAKLVNMTTKINNNANTKALKVTDKADSATGKDDKESAANVGCKYVAQPQGESGCVLELNESWNSPCSSDASPEFVSVGSSEEFVSLEDNVTYL